MLLVETSGSRRASMQHTLLLGTALASSLRLSCANAQATPDGAAAVFEKSLRCLPREPAAGFARADPRCPPQRRAGGHPHRADGGKHVRAGSVDHRRPNGARSPVSWQAGRSAPRLRPPTSATARRKPAPLKASALESGWNGWGADQANTRFQTAARAGLKAADVPRLTLKWAYGFPGVNSARSQPAVLGGRLFIASESGDVVRSTRRPAVSTGPFMRRRASARLIAIAPYKTKGTSGFAAYFADGSATAYAIDTTTGRRSGIARWTTTSMRVPRDRWRFAVIASMSRPPASAKKARVAASGTSAARSAAA